MSTINTILIANRGEIASRVIRTCKKMGIRSIAVHSPIDDNLPFVHEADIAVKIGDNAPQTSYLDQELIIKTAKEFGADAIHPGYGFLSENADFAALCAKNNIIFIGPNVEAIKAMGSKSEAKILMRKNKVPTIPGYEGQNQDTAYLISEAKKVGFPLLLKATAGGGGKGMRVVEKEKELAKSIEAAKRESLSAFGNDELIIEKYISSGRHIEFQIFGDQYGHAIHLLERECTIQRRHQKVLEESPSPVMNEKLRKTMGEAAVNAAKALNYDNAGTVEFIYDDNTKEFFFLEVNTRLQVEHPVTEAITGLDLVKMQIESAEGKKLNLKQNDVNGKGYAIEFRLYAEDPNNDFLPVTGKIKAFQYQPMDGLRVESAIEQGSDISIHYDPMIAKIIVHDDTRAAAMRKMGSVLDNMVCLGTVTNQDFLKQLVRNESIIRGNYNTHFLAEQFKLDDQTAQHQAHFLIAATLKLHQERKQNQLFLKQIPGGWRNNHYRPQQEYVTIGDERMVVKYRQKENDFEFYFHDNTLKATLISCANDQVKVRIHDATYLFTVAQDEEGIHLHQSTLGTLSIKRADRFPSREKEVEKGSCTAPMPSQVVDILVKPREKVKEGDPLVILSSMKMENTIYASENGVVEEVFTQNGENIEAGFTILKINPN